jgi:hypothetical protein
MRRVPLLSGSRIVLVPIEDDDVVLQPPPPPAGVVDTAPAVRDALRFPLAGPPLAGLVQRASRATIVVEPPALPMPGATADPRRDALASVIEELGRCGIPDDRLTILVAGGLGRRLGQRDLEQLLPRPQARAFRGHVRVHNAASLDLVAIAEHDGRAISADRALVETDVVVVVSAAETILHGGPGSLLAACDASTVRRAAKARTLLQASGAPEWNTALAVESALASKVPVTSVSLVLDHPRLTGTFRDYPHEESSLEHVRRSPFRRAFSLLPSGPRRAILGAQGRRIATSAVYAGRLSVAHAEALLRGVELRGAHLPEPLDTLVVGVPWIGPHVPRELVNPVTASAITLGLALRQWRDAFPVRDGGTVVLVHSLRRRFTHGTRDPYRALFDALASGGPEAAWEAERTAGSDERSLAVYRAGGTCHPLLPFADWAGCQPALARLGRVIVAGSRDAAAARALGFVPTHSITSALEMAHGLAGRRARVGVLLAPPYSPLLVGRSTRSSEAS